MNKKVFVRLGVATIAAVYLLILVGGIVRATGSGMGCPDWPKCFGTWIPPTSVDQLPIDYQEVFGAKLKGEVEFNVFKTWTEYINRLLGVLIGFLIFLTFISSVLVFWKKDRMVVGLTFLSFILVGFQGWLGSKVVSTELLPWMVTTHLLVAVLIVLVLIWAIIRSHKKTFENIESDAELSFAIPLLFILSLGQFVLGTRVREEIDGLNHAGTLRSEWISQLSGSLYVHIGLAIGILILHWLIYLKSKSTLNEQIRTYFYFLVIMVSASFISGSVLGLFEMTSFSQPFHLTFATLILGNQFAIYLINQKAQLIN